MAMGKDNKVQPSISRFFSFAKQSDATPVVETVIDIESDEEIAPPKHTPIGSFKFDRDAKVDASHDEDGKAAVRDSFRAALLHGQKRKLEDTSRPAKKKAKSPFDQLTPLEQQAVTFKRENPDKVLAIQVGYKFKFFGEDAAKVHKILSIMLVPGKKSLDLDDPEEAQYERIAYCSIPENRLHIHLKRLLDSGLKVGVIEQVEAAAIKSQSAGKNSLFERALTRVYTSGTYVDDDSFDSIFHKSGNYIVALKETETVLALVAVQLASGEIIYDHFKDDVSRNELETRLLHLSPSEFLIIDSLMPETELCLKNFTSHQKSSVRITRVESDTYSNYLNDHSSLFEDVEFIQSLQEHVRTACFEMIKYLKEFKLESVFDRTDNFQSFTVDNYMTLNNQTLKNLEIFQNSTNGEEKGSLIALLDHTRTKFGYRTLKRWISKPSIHRGEILERQDSIESLIANYNHRIVDMLTGYLKSCQDLEKCLNRIHFQKCSMKEIYPILQKINALLELINSYEVDELACFNPSLREQLTDLKGLAKELTGFELFLDMVNSHVIKDEWLEPRQQKLNYFNSRFFNYEELQAERDKIKTVERQLEEELVKIRVQLRRPQLQYTTNNKEKYLIEVRNTEVSKLPKTWLKFNSTKSVSRFFTPEVSKMIERIKYHEELVIEKTELNFKKYLAKIDSYYTPLSRTVRNLGRLDALLSLSAISANYTRPEMVDSQCIDLKDSCNPIIDMLNPDRAAIANDIRMDPKDGRILVITGPNMGGKSSLIKQIAIVCIMAQIGCSVPARSATLGIFTQIFIRMGSADNIMKGESTFQLEMLECLNIIKHKDDRSLILLDEIGRGTSTNDGFAIAFSILDYLATESGAFVLFITHFNKLSSFEHRFHMVKNYHMGYLIDGVDLTFLYKFVRGFCSKSYGINVARLTSIADEIITNAEKVSKEYEQEFETKLAVNWSVAVRDALAVSRTTSTSDPAVVLKLRSLVDHIQ